MSARLEIRNLVFRYPDGTPALRGFNARIEPGECVGLVGPNGSGKTTLVMVLAGFYRPAAGTMVMDDRPLDDTELAARRRRIGFTFHNPDDQLFMPTVLEDVLFGPLCAGEPPETAEPRARAQLAELGLDRLATRFPGHLSAGQKRLATLAGVLVMNPDLLVLDEPSAFLDPYSRRQVIRLIAGLSQSRLLITHDLDMAAELCRRVIVLSEGRNVADGPADQILSDAALMHAHHLESPAGVRRNPVER